MIHKEKLYEAFGELIYAVAKVDGEVQSEEMVMLKQILEGHEWGDDIIWSFNYEEGKNRSVKEAYNRAMDIFSEYGPYEEYNKFFDVLEKVAESSDGIDENERQLIDQFKSELLKKFMNDNRIR